MPTVQHEIRYLTAEELVRLRRHAEADAVRARERGTVGGSIPSPGTLIVQWMLESRGANPS